MAGQHVFGVPEVPVRHRWLGWFFAAIVLMAASPKAFGQPTHGSPDQGAADADESGEESDQASSESQPSESSSSSGDPFSGGPGTTAIRIPVLYAANFAASALLATPAAFIGWLIGLDAGALLLGGVVTVSSQTAVTHFIGNNMGGSGPGRALGTAVGATASWGLGWWYILEGTEGSFGGNSLAIPFLIWSAGPVIGYELANAMAHGSDGRRRAGTNRIRVSPAAAIAPDGDSGFVGIDITF